MSNLNNDKDNEEIQVNQTMVDELVSELLKLEQDHLYVKKHGLKEEILKLIKSRIR